MTRAIMFIRSDDFDPHATRCTQHIEKQGYEFKGVVTDDWDAAQDMLDERKVDVVVVSTEEHLPAKRKPRIEVVANQAASIWEARTRVIRRNAAR